jgi:hypothetical protein
VQRIVRTAAVVLVAQIKPGEFQEFPVSLGPLPTDTDKLVFKAVQTYSDNSEVSWIQEPGAEHPAPVLSLTAKAASSGPVVAAATTGADSDSALPVTLGVIGAVLGLGGLVLGGLAFARTRRTPAVADRSAPARLG